MKLFLLPLLLILGGCAASLEDLYLQRTACLAYGDECEEVHESIDRRERHIEQRAYDRRSRCPGNLIEYCNERMRGCGRRHKSPTDEFSCMSAQQANEFLGGSY